MRSGLLGGSFDPIHRGHVAGARAALAELALDEVLFLPTAVPPQPVAPPARESSFPLIGVTSVVVVMVAGAVILARRRRR